MATIKQIAEKAGVSPTTVSNVLHGKTAKVSPATLDKVRAILTEEKYAPNMGAIILAHSNSRIIGVIMFMQPRRNETVLEDPFTSTIIGALEQEIRDNGYFTMLHTTDDEDDVLRLAATWKLDGLILILVPGEICGAIMESIDTPVVFVDCYFTDSGKKYHNVGLDDRRGGYEVAGHLLSMGHTEITFLANGSCIPGGDIARFEGCRRAFAERGLILSIDRFVPLGKDIHDREKTYQKMISDSGRTTALIFSSDYYAAEAVMYYQEIGVDVPGRISVTGFDDNIFARLIRPRLTSVHQDAFIKGQRAVEMLMRLIRGDDVPEPDVRLPVRLEIRDSVKKLS